MFKIVPLSVYTCWTTCITRSTPIQNVESAIRHDYLYHLMAASAIMLKLFTDNICPISSVKYMHMPMCKHILKNNALFWIRSDLRAYEGNV